MEIDFNMRLLIVDDYSSMRKVLKNSLKQIGFLNIAEAGDGKAAFEVLEQEKIDLIISDWNMPTMSGLEFLKAVRSSKDHKDIPFIMVTAEGMKQNIIDAMKAGVSNYVVKPFTTQVIQDKINQVLSKRIK